jgi:hypothetical protein
MPELGTLLETRVLVLPKLGALQTMMGAVVPELETVSKIHDAVMPAAGAFLESATRRAKAMKTAITASPPFLGPAFLGAPRTYSIGPYRWKFAIGRPLVRLCDISRHGVRPGTAHVENRPNFPPTMVDNRVPWSHSRVVLLPKSEHLGHTSQSNTRLPSPLALKIVQDTARRPP